MRRLGSSSAPVPLNHDDAYAAWAATYPPRPHNALMRAEQAVVAGIVASLAPRRAVDVGSGTGRGLALLTAAGARFVAGVDRSPEMLRHAHGWPGRLVRGDAEALPLRSDSCDLVVSSLMAGDLDTVATWVGEAARILEPGGHLVYSDFHPTWLERGWTRTFEDTDGRTFSLPFRTHRLDDHEDALTAAGLTRIACHEFALPNDGSAATDDMRRRWRDPLIGVVVHARKPAPRHGPENGNP